MVMAGLAWPAAVETDLRSLPASSMTERAISRASAFIAEALFYWPVAEQ